MRQKFPEVYELTSRIVKYSYSVHITERNRIRIVKHNYIAIRCVLPKTSNGGTSKFRSVEMNYTNILLHNKKGRDRSRPKWLYTECL